MPKLELPPGFSPNRTMVVAVRCGIDYFEIPMAELDENLQSAWERFWKLSLHHQKPLGAGDELVLRCQGNTQTYALELDPDGDIPLKLICKSPMTP
jgi:hypothetical protein